MSADRKRECVCVCLFLSYIRDDIISMGALGEETPYSAAQYLQEEESL